MHDILILCTGNSARSIMAEALINHLGGTRLRGHSAGSQPKAEPHPMALRCLHEAGVATTGLHSKSWDVFTGADAPRLDLVLTVCDAAAGEACPLFPGAAPRVHWGLPDPPAASNDDVRWQRFCAVRDALIERIHGLLAVPEDAWGGADFARRIRAIHDALPQPLTD